METDWWRGDYICEKLLPQLSEVLDGLQKSTVIYDTFFLLCRVNISPKDIH